MKICGILYSVVSNFVLYVIEISVHYGVGTQHLLEFLSCLNCNIVAICML